MQSRVNADARLVHRGRWVNQPFLGIGNDDYLISIVVAKSPLSGGDIWQLIQVNFQSVLAQSWQNTGKCPTT